VLVGVGNPALLPFVKLGSNPIYFGWAGIGAYGWQASTINIKVLVFKVLIAIFSHYLKVAGAEMDSCLRRNDGTGEGMAERGQA